MVLTHSVLCKKYPPNMTLAPRRGTEVAEINQKSKQKIILTTDLPKCHRTFFLNQLKRNIKGRGAIFSRTNITDVKSRNRTWFS